MIKDLKEAVDRVRSQSFLHGEAALVEFDKDGSTVNDTLFVGGFCKETYCM